MSGYSSGQDYPETSSYGKGDEERLVTRIIELATWLTGRDMQNNNTCLNGKGWKANHHGVGRIWKREGLKVLKKQPKRGRLGLNDGSCIRLRPENKDRVSSYGFMAARTTEGRAFRILIIIDEYTGGCVTILTQRPITFQNVIKQLFYRFILSGIREYIHI